ncbi:MAG TPA: hypothetical protein VFS07_10235 [Gemmatimonadales bacterium]|nr:hypothetical protein [Gemmatimonadales bacterium]
MRTVVGTLALLGSLLLVRDAEGQAATRNPHGTLPSGLECTRCHTTEGWRPVRRPLPFDHGRETRFPLEGMHAQAACLACHLGGRFDEPRLSTSECATCHVDVHQGNLGTECGACHTPTRFREVNGVGLHVRTGFPLTGAHLQVTCAACHRDAQNGAYTALDRECIACHRAEYAGARTVDHVAAGFPTDCRRCHGDLTWQGGVSFDHLAASQGRFALLGAHAELRCASCHIPPSGALKWTPAGQNDCVACHQGDYTAAHGGSGFPTTCADCHSVNNWDSNFDHGTATGGQFVLAGAHVSLPCSGCHAAGTFQPKWPATGQNDCVACHQADYDREHTGSGFPTTCLTCHTTSTWGNASFRDHDAQYFPIYSGAHQGTWSSCATCHTAPADYGTYTCLVCHAHDQPSMDSHHSEVAGYSYASQACYGCHPRGRN